MHTVFNEKWHKQNIEEDAGWPKPSALLLIKIEFSINFNFLVMKKNYVKPTMEIVEVQLSDCIAGSGSTKVSIGIVNHQQIVDNASLGSTSKW